MLSTSLHAQGCTQCLDNTAATPPGVQAGYRHAIILMTLAASSLFIGTVVLLKRFR
ncbi:MAG: copper resistance protein CopC [Acidobacteriota bacterium]|nr:copper resistance protein CopC [Acidobacteriota bacterium]